MTLESFRIYQTLAQSGVPYPTLPAAPDLETKVNDAPNVYYVAELTDVEFDETQNNPSITSTDTGKRFNMYVISGGPVLGDYAAFAGTTRAYIPEGNYLLGWWYNGQLFGVPLTVGDGITYNV